MVIVWSAVLALAAAASAGADDDEGLRDLAARVARLEAERQEASAVKEKQDESKGLPDRVSALEKKMGSAGQTYDSSRMLAFATPDGNFTAKIGGRIYTVYRHIFDAGQNGSNAKDSFMIDSARFQLDGTFFKDFYYRLEGEAKSGETVNGVLSTGFFRTKDIYIGWQGLGDWLGFQMGQFKQPMSQEETCSSRFIDFAERSILNRLIPGHVQGVMAKGALFDKTIEWFLGFNNGVVARDSDRGSVDTNDEKGEFFRLFIAPLKNTDMALFKTMRLGFDVSDAKIDNTTVAGSGLGAVSSGDLGIPNILQFTPGAAFIQGHLTRVDLNFSWNYGPMSLRAEYFRQRTQLENAAANAYEIAAWYVQVTYLLTGEEKPLENRVKPKNNFDPLAGGWGAWELAARVAVVDAHDAVAAGIATAKTGQGVGSNHKTVEYTFGVNWWMTPNVALRIDWEHLSFDTSRVLGRFTGLRKGEDEIYIRWQIDF